MYLYNKNGNDIEVYDIIPNRVGLKKFKAEELINFENANNELLYRLKTYTDNETNFIFESLKKGNNINYSEIVYKNGFRIWAKLIAEPSFHTCIIKKYVNGEFDRHKASKILDDDKNIKHYFMELEKCSCDKRICQLNCVLNLPESLYYLQMIQLGNYKEFIKADELILNKIVSLYDIEFIDKHDIGLLTELYHQGLGKNPLPIIQNSPNSEEVLKRIRTAKK